MIKFSTTMFNAMMGIGTVFNNLTVYSGTPPTVDNNFVFATANYTGQQLGTMTVACQTVNGAIVFKTTPATTNATATGTATWFALHNGSTTAILASVGGSGSVSPLQLQSVDLVQGQPIAPVQLSVQFAG